MTKWSEHGTTRDGTGMGSARRDNYGTTRNGTRMGQSGTGHEWDNAERDKNGTTRDGTSMGQRGTGKTRDNGGRDKTGITRDGTGLDLPTLLNQPMHNVYMAAAFLIHTDLQILIRIKLISAPPSPGQAIRAGTGFIIKSTIGAVMLIPVR